MEKIKRIVITSVIIFINVILIVVVAINIAKPIKRQLALEKQRKANPQQSQEEILDNGSEEENNEESSQFESSFENSITENGAMVNTEQNKVGTSENSLEEENNTNQSEIINEGSKKEENSKQEQSEITEENSEEKSLDIIGFIKSIKLEKSDILAIVESILGFILINVGIAILLKLKKF